MFKMLGVLVFLTILCSINGSLSEKKRIHGGHKIDAPFVVHTAVPVPETENLYFLCTASLIKPQYILTAAHCLEGATRVKVTYGCSDLRNENKCKKVEVKDFRIHPKYLHVENKSLVNDIAVAMLQYPIRGITPIRLPNRSVDSGHMATLMGWGRTETSGEKSSKILLSITRPIAEVRKEEILVNYTNEKRTNKGDSGGPLLIEKTIFGVLAGTRNTTRGGIVSRYGLFMNVNHYLGFIYESMASMKTNHNVF